MRVCLKRNYILRWFTSTYDMSGFVNDLVESGYIILILILTSRILPKHIGGVYSLVLISN